MMMGHQVARRFLPGVLLPCVAMALCGCAKLESHLTVHPDSSTDMALQMRVPVPLSTILQQALGRQGMPELPTLPGVRVTDRDEGLEHVWELSLSGAALTTMGVCTVESEQRALSTRYSLTLDPQRANPLAAVGLLPGGIRPASGKVTGREWRVANGAPAQSLGDLAEQLKQLRDMLGSLGLAQPQNFTPNALTRELQPALYAHLPGRLTDTNGERVDDSTARWRFDPARLRGGPLTACSALPDRETVEGLAQRLSSHLGCEVEPQKLEDLVWRGLLPNPVVEERKQASLEVNLYGALFMLANGLDETIGPEKTDAVVKALGLTGDDPSLWLAMRAAKRLPRLRELAHPADLSVEELTRLLSGREA